MGTFPIYFPNLVVLRLRIIVNSIQNQVKCIRFDSISKIVLRSFKFTYTFAMKQTILKQHCCNIKPRKNFTLHAVLSLSSYIIYGYLLESFIIKGEIEQIILIKKN